MSDQEEYGVTLGPQDGFGIGFYMYSTYQDPPHFSVYDLKEEKTLGDILIQDEEPKSIDDIIPCEGSSFTDDQKELILKALLHIPEFDDSDFLPVENEEDYEEDEPEQPVWMANRSLWRAFHR